MLRKTLVILLASIAILGAAYLFSFRNSAVSPEARTSSIDWNEFRCEEGRFSILMPGPVRRGSLPVEISRAQNTKATTFESEAAGIPARFFVLYFTSRPEGDTETVLENIALGLCQEHHGKLRAIQKISCGKHPGREVAFEYHDSKGSEVEQTRVFCTGEKYYHITVTVPKDLALEDFVTKYLDSFQLLED